jgi:hypothetical protein
MLDEKKGYFVWYLERILSENEEDEVFLYRLFKVMLNIENKTPQCLSLALLKGTRMRTEPCHIER